VSDDSLLCLDPIDLRHVVFYVKPNELDALEYVEWTAEKVWIDHLSQRKTIEMSREMSQKGAAAFQMGHPRAEAAVSRRGSARRSLFPRSPCSADHLLDGKPLVLRASVPHRGARTIRVSRLPDEVEAASLREHQVLYNVPQAPAPVGPPHALLDAEILELLQQLASRRVNAV
jgi:hypothetical protein